MLKEYLSHLGMPDAFEAKSIPCEICECIDHTIIRRTANFGNGRRGTLPVVSCRSCGFLFQNPRFDRAFYDLYYSTYYRPLTSGSSTPDDGFVADQVERGEYLFASLAAHLPAAGRLLDVGCSAGGLMWPFIKRGWEALGVDPDQGFAAYGKDVLELPVKAGAAEDMELVPDYYDLIIITGSLEHVVDPNRVLALCRRAARPSSLLVLEGRGLAQCRQIGSCGHNHRRYLSAVSMELFMLKHGWEPVLTTTEELCGPTRPGSVFCLGRAGEAGSLPELRRQIASGRREHPEIILEHFRQWQILP